MEKETHTWQSSFAHKDVDDAAASDLVVEARQFNSNTESVKVFGRHPQRGIIVVSHARWRLHMLRRNISGTNGKGFPFNPLSLLHDNLHPSSKRASTMHTDTGVSRVEMLFCANSRFLRSSALQQLGENGHAFAQAFPSIPVLRSAI